MIGKIGEGYTQLRITSHSYNEAWIEDATDNIMK